MRPGSAKHRWRLRACAALLLCVAESVSAQSTAPIPLREYLDAVVAHNLDLRAQRETEVSAQAGVSLAGVRPDPQFNGGIASKELYAPNRPNASTATTAGVAFTLETAGKRDARLRAAHSNVRLSETNVAAFKRQLEADAAAAFIDGCSAQATLARKESSLGAMREIVRANEIRMNAGDIGRLELSQSRVEADRFEADVVNARAASKAADLNLATFLGAPREQRFPARELECSWHDPSIEDDVDDLVRRALAARDDVHQARAAVENARDNLELARANRWVDPTISLALTNTPRVSPILDSGGNITNMPAERSVTLSLTVSVPIPLSRSQQGELTQAGSAVTQAELQLRSIQLKAETEVRQAYVQFSATSLNVQTYGGRVVAEAQHVLEGTRTSYRKGATSLLELLNAQRSADDVYLSYVQALADRANATVKLQLGTGERPEL